MKFTSLTVIRSPAAEGTVVASTNTNINEELDNLMDISIEIASNKRMKKDNIKPFRLTFKDKDLEKKVGGWVGSMRDAGCTICSETWVGFTFTEHTAYSARGGTTKKLAL